MAPWLSKRRCLEYHVGLEDFLLHCYVPRVSLFLFYWETLTRLLSIQEILVHFVGHVFIFHFLVFLLVCGEARVTHFLKTLASSVPRTMLIRVVLLGITDPIGILSPVESVVVHD